MANTKITTNVIADNAVGITQLNVSDGSSGQFLRTDGSGTLSFATVSTTTALDDIATGDAASTLATSSGNITIDSPADIILDADGTDIILKDGGTEFSRLMTDSTPNHFYLKSSISDADMIFQGNDGGSTITALTLDMSEAGLAEFSAQVRGPSQAASAPTFSFTNDTDTGISRPTTNALNLITAGSERVRIEADGTTVIGHTGSVGTNTKSILQLKSGLNLLKGDGTAIVGSLYLAASGSRSISIAADPDDGGADTYMNFLLDNSEAMRLTSTGQLTIGNTGTGTEKVRIDVGSATTPNLNIRAGGQASAYGAVKFNNTNGEVGSISMLASSVAYNTSSDYRLKEKVNYTWDATTKLKQLKPCEFEFKKDTDNTVHQGFLAHEAKSVIPTSVFGEKDASEMQQMDHSKLVPLLVKTIQELEARITELEK